MSNVNHIIITRCNFNNDNLFEKYFDVMLKTYIPSIKSQTNKNFKIALIVNPSHLERIKSHIGNQIEILSFSDDKTEYRDYVIKNNVTIQTRHDCDDIMLPSYVEYIHKLYEEHKNKYDDFILNFHPTKIDISTGDEYTHSRDYSKVCSMFSTLIQKNVKNGIMDVVHDHLSSLTKNIIYINKNFVKLGIHGNNSFSKINPNDKKIEKNQFSIIIPTYNIINYLDECLDSVIQSIKNIECEILVGIDGCEKTLEHIKNKKFDERINFYYFEENLGPYIIKNSLSLITQSDYILFFDSDDIMNEILVQDIITYKNSYQLLKPMYLNFNVDRENIDYNNKETNSYGEGVFGIDKQFFLKMNGFEGWRCAADSDLMTRLYKNQIKIIHTKSVGFYRRVHGNSLTQHPETSYSSQMRGKYSLMSREKTSFEPLEILITHPFKKINNDKIINDHYDFHIPIKKNKEDLLKEKRDSLFKNDLKFNIKSRDNVDDNQQIINDNKNDFNIHTPSNGFGLNKENTSVERNKLFEVKKGTVAAQTLHFLPKKRKRDNSNNPFKKNKF